MRAVLLAQIADLQWRLPDQPTGSVYFIYTVLYTYGTGTYSIAR